jgi:hypothetical protein
VGPCFLIARQTSLTHGHELARLSIVRRRLPRFGYSVGDRTAMMSAPLLHSLSRRFFDKL